MRKFSGEKVGRETIFRPLLVGKLKNTRELGELSGETILIEREMLWRDVPLNIAFSNYNRRRKINLDDAEEWMDTTIFYGHIGGYGYIVGADEISGELRKMTPEDKIMW